MAPVVREDVAELVGQGVELPRADADDDRRIRDPEARRPDRLAAQAGVAELGHVVGGDAAGDPVVPDEPGLLGRQGVAAEVVEGAVGAEDRVALRGRERLDGRGLDVERRLSIDGVRPGDVDAHGVRDAGELGDVDRHCPAAREVADDPAGDGPEDAADDGADPAADQPADACPDAATDEAADDLAEQAVVAAVAVRRRPAVARPLAGTAV